MLSPYHWKETMEKQGKEVYLTDGLPFSCLLFDNTGLVCIGISTTSIEEAIKKCSERYGMKNLAKYLLQHANSKIR